MTADTGLWACPICNRVVSEPLLDVELFEGLTHRSLRACATCTQHFNDDPDPMVTVICSAPCPPRRTMAVA